jgi:KaiC/GvpD/RAD55 family RecA-like ATPase
VIVIHTSCSSQPRTQPQLPFQDCQRSGAELDVESDKLFLSILDDKIRTQRTRRLVFDSVSHLALGGAIPAELRQLLRALVARLKSQGVTSMFTLESDSMHSTDTVTGLGYSAIADNILMLRYVSVAGDF